MAWFRSKRMKAKGAVSAAPPRLEAMEARDVPAFVNYGGGLLTSVEAQALYLGSTWAGAGSERVALDNYLKDLTGSPYMGALKTAGYGVGTGTASAGAYDGTAFASGSVVSDSTIQARIQADIKTGTVLAPDANRLYVVYVDPNVAVGLGGNQTTQNGILGYHGAFNGSDAGGNAITIHYAVMVTPGGPAHNSTSSIFPTAFDQLTAVTSHETAEAATDPNGPIGRAGWYDYAKNGENGDITENLRAAYVRQDGYLVQEVADRNDGLLSIAVSPPPVSPPVSPPPVSPPPVAGSTATSSALRVTSAYRIGNPNGPALVNMTVTLSSSAGSVPAGGTVDLMYNGQVLAVGTVKVVNGVATASFSVMIYPHGLFSFTTQYLGAGSYHGSASNSVTIRT